MSSKGPLDPFTGTVKESFTQGWRWYRKGLAPRSRDGTGKQSSTWNTVIGFRRPGSLFRKFRGKRKEEGEFFSCA